MENGASNTVLDFGDVMRKEFMLRNDVTNLNHGSHGGIPRSVHDRQVGYLQELESQPDLWYWFNSPKYLNKAVRQVSNFIGTASKDTFLLQNVTKAINTVLKTFPLSSGDAYLISTLTYGSVQVIAQAVTRHFEDPLFLLHGAKTYTLDIQLPIRSADDIVEKYDEFLRLNPEVKLVVIDHITSPTSVVLPVKRLVEVCHSHDVIVIVDGAHAPGMLTLNLEDMDADFYTGNLHKWVFTPRSCAFLWRNPNRRHLWFRPLVTSELDDKGLQMAFSYEGTKDDIPYICSIDGIEYYNNLGGRSKILNYTIPLRKRATSYLETAWKTSAIEIPENMIAPNLRVIRLPQMPKYKRYSSLDLMKVFLDRYGIQVHVFVMSHVRMVRISVQIYNTMDDYITLANAVLSLAEER